MADESRKFEIEIATKATGAGVEETEAKLASLKEKEATVAGGAGVLPFTGAGTAEALSDAEKQAAIESQLQVIAQTRLELVQAQTAGDEARVAVLRYELAIRQAILGVMRTEALTQAELNDLAVSEEAALGAAGVTGKAATEGIAAGSLLASVNLTKARQEGAVLVRELTTGGNVMRTLGSFLSAFPGGFAVAAIAGIAVYEAIKKSNEETEKLINETQQLGDEIVKAGTKWQDAARGALTPEDVRQIAAAAIPELEKVHAKVSEIQQTELHWWQSAIQQIRAGMLETLPYVPSSFRKFATPYTDQLDQIKENAAALEKADQQAAAGAIRSGKLFEEAFERRKAEPLSQALKEIVGTISKLEAQQKALDTGAVDYAKRYDDIGTKIEQNEKQIRPLIQLERERTEFNKINAETLDVQKTKAQEIQEALERAESTLRSLGVDARDLATAFAVGERTAGEMGERIRQAATEAEKARAEAKAEADKETGSASPQVKQILANEQAASQARAQGEDRDAELYEKSAQQFEAGASPEQLAELANIRKLRQESKPPPAAPTISPGGETGTGGPSLIGPAAEAARKADLERINHETTQRAIQARREAEKHSGEAAQRVREEEIRKALEGGRVGQTAGDHAKDATLKDVLGVLRSLQLLWS